jgi:PAS domain-containing protein
MKIPNLEHLSYLALCALSDGVIIINRCGRVLFMNQAAQQLTGSEIKEPGISLDEVFLPI